MPPADDPLARLHGRLAFDRTLEDGTKHLLPRKASFFVPRVSGKPIDLYSLFEVVRAARNIQGLPKRYAYKLAREYLQYPDNSSYPDMLRTTYIRWCQPFFKRLQSDVEAVYATESFTEQTHKWLIDRVKISNDESGGEPQVLLRDRCEAFTGSKSIDPDATEEQAFLNLPEPIQAVIRARLKEGTLAAEERAHYLFKTQEADRVLIELRNHIIRMWYRNSRERLRVYTALSMVPGRFHDLGCRIFTYLECVGIINFGTISLSSPMAVHLTNQKQARKKIAIIGAGMSGLIAARQLRSFGFGVTVFEARQRPGGRVYTETELLSAPVDMGAMLITGVLQNPVAVLAHQTKSVMHFMEASCPLFDIDGTLVSKESDSWAEKEYNCILDVTNRYRTSEDSAGIASTKSLGQAFQRALSRRLKRRAARLRASMAAADNSNNAVPGRAERGSRNRGTEEEGHVMVSGGRTRPVPNVRSSTGPSTQRRAQRTSELTQEDDLARKRAKVANEMKRDIGSSSESPSFNESGDERRQSLNAKVVSRLLRWHIANLEYACAASIYNVSLVHWDQDDPYALSGEHVLLQKGYKPLIDGLVNGLERYLKFGRKVTKIDYSAGNGSVKVSVEGKRRNAEDMEFDSVLVTVPLGVLKSGSISFTPSLPANKQLAIDRLGFGGLMKVAMEWSECFWVKDDMFGALRESVELRGEFYFFWNLAPCTGKPILVGVVADPLVAKMEKLPDKEIVDKAVKVLRNVYPEAPDPKAFVVSRWSQDECAGGAYTHIPVGSSGADYDTLASPVGSSLFFGGEHTCRQYPTTCASAIISGLREANRIAEAHNMVGKIKNLHSKNLAKGHLL